MVLLLARQLQSKDGPPALPVGLRPASCCQCPRDGAAGRTCLHSDTAVIQQQRVRGATVATIARQAAPESTAALQLLVVNNLHGDNTRSCEASFSRQGMTDMRVPGPEARGRPAAPAGAAQLASCTAAATRARLPASSGEILGSKYSHKAPVPVEPPLGARCQGVADGGMIELAGAGRPLIEQGTRTLHQAQSINRQFSGQWLWAVRGLAARLSVATC